MINNFIIITIILVFFLIVIFYFSFFILYFITFYFIYLFIIIIKLIFPFILSFFSFFRKKGVEVGRGGGLAAGGMEETNISKYVNNFLGTNPTILSSLLSEF